MIRGPSAERAIASSHPDSKLSALTLIFLVGALLSELCSAGCGSNPSAPLSMTPDSVSVRLSLDRSPAWSADGSLLAFRRNFPSIYGDAGLYVLHSGDGYVERMAPLGPSGPFWPINPSFSRDGAKLLYIQEGYTLALCDVRSHDTTTPITTHNGVDYADFSPDGGCVVYSRALRFPDEAPDSGGVHILNLRTGADSTLRDALGNIIFGKNPRWSPDGRYIAYLTGVGAPFYEAQVVRFDTKTRTTVLLLASGPNGSSVGLNRYLDQRTRAPGLCVSIGNSASSGMFYIPWTGGSPVRQVWMEVYDAAPLEAGGAVAYSHVVTSGDPGLIWKRTQMGVTHRDMRVTSASSRF